MESIQDFERLQKEYIPLGNVIIPMTISEQLEILRLIVGDVSDDEEDTTYD